MKNIFAICLVSLFLSAGVQASTGAFGQQANPNSAHKVNMHKKAVVKHKTAKHKTAKYKKSHSKSHKSNSAVKVK